MVSKLYSLGILGMDSFIVTVESDIFKALPSFDIVGLPDASIKESRDRVRSALKNCGYDFPTGKITINLAPADIKKEGSIYDLAILLSLLKSTGHINSNLDDSVFLGELSLSGDLRPINGILPMTIKAKESGFKNIFVPIDNSKEACVVEGINVYAIKNIKELLDHLILDKELICTKQEDTEDINDNYILDFCQVKGQLEAKRALEIAAAGGHNVILIGPPGSGKSMLAKRIPSILPDMTFSEQIETTKIHSIAGVLKRGSSIIRQRPFRSPHHTVSAAGLSGGGRIPHPGELSLAHNGVLFLDELPEFSKSSMEVLRQPMEDNSVTISRVSGTLTYPCSVMLVAAMNPCPCGYFGHPTKYCTCTSSSVSKYLSRVSGPLLDRLDIHVEVPPVDFDDLSSFNESEPSAIIKERVNKARNIQNDRYKNTSISCNARLDSSMIQKACKMDDIATNLLKKAFDRLSLSARAYDRILKVARTIADLDNSEIIKSNHVSEAIQYRSLDRKYWNREL